MPEALDLDLSGCLEAGSDVCWGPWGQCRFWRFQWDEASCGKLHEVLPKDNHSSKFSSVVGLNMAERTDARMSRWMHTNIRQQFWVQTVPMGLLWFDTAYAARDCIFDIHLFVYECGFCVLYTAKKLGCWCVLPFFAVLIIIIIIIVILFFFIIIFVSATTIIHTQVPPI